MSQSVKQCITVDLFPHILANAVDIQKVHLLLHTPLLNKTPRLSSARMFVRLYRLLLIHCIYVSVTKPTCPAFSAWLNTGAIRSMKVTGKAIMLSLSLNKIHSYARLNRHTKRQKVQFIVFKTRTKRIGEA